jgi:hypothetical protein
MKRHDCYPSRYLTAADLNGLNQTLTIKDVALADMGDDTEKPVITFSDCAKGLVCNITNWSTIEELYGEDSDDWINKQITLFPTKVEMKGKRVLAIRIRDVKPAPNGRTTKPKPTAEFDEFDSPNEGRKTAASAETEHFTDPVSTSEYLLAVEGERGLHTKANEAWNARWTAPNGEIPACVKDPCNKFQLDNYLVKAAITAGHLPKDALPAGGWKPEYLGRLTAKLFYGAHKKWLYGEIVSYLATCAEKAEAALRKSNPELFDPTQGPGDGEIMDEWSEGRER